MKRKKYDIHPDFQKWANFNTPLNKVSLMLMQKTMSLLYLKEKTDKQVEVNKLQIPYGVGKMMRALLYSPKNIEKNCPLLIYIHGGGFVMPAAPHHYNNARKYAIGAKCKVLMLDYPIAPSFKFPIPVNACFDAYKWVLDNATNLSINKTKIVFGGDSAGGNLSSIVILMAHDNNLIIPCGQMLMYPAIGLDYETESMKEFTDTPLCNSKDYKIYMKYYFNSKQDLLDKYVSPMNANNFKIYPITYIETAEFDCLRDEALIFGEELKKAGIKTIINKTKGTIHAYDMSEDSEITKTSIAKRIEFLNNCFNKGL